MSKLFDVCPRSTMEEMEHKNEVRVAWGTGIAGHVAESGEPVNISDAYKVSKSLFHGGGGGCSPLKMDFIIIFQHKS